MHDKWVYIQAENIRILGILLSAREFSFSMNHSIVSSFDHYLYRGICCIIITELKRQKAVPFLLGTTEVKAIVFSLVFTLYYQYYFPCILHFVLKNK